MRDQTRSFASAAAVLVLLISVGLIYQDSNTPDQNNESLAEVDVQEVEDSMLRAVFIDENSSIAELKLEKAETPEERTKGLMGRKSLENGTGMIFVWNESDERSFWMKNTYIGLDMVFVTADKTIRTIKKADPEPNVSDEDLKTYTSEGPVQYVIEAKQNFTERNGVEEGHKVSFNLSS